MSKTVCSFVCISLLVWSNELSDEQAEALDTGGMMQAWYMTPSSRAHI